MFLPQLSSNLLHLIATTMFFLVRRSSRRYRKKFVILASPLFQTDLGPMLPHVSLARLMSSIYNIAFELVKNIQEFHNGKQPVNKLGEGRTLVVNF